MRKSVLYRLQEEIPEALEQLAEEYQELQKEIQRFSASSTSSA